MAWNGPAVIVHGMDVDGVARLRENIDQCLGVSRFLGHFIEIYWL